ncbi:MAG: hypothetical protein ACYS22_00900 [Planctomycetota bacterium]|jgi:hypothetical protein
MIVHEGLIGAFNYTVGPALIYESKDTVDLIKATGDPYIVVVPDTIPPRELFSTPMRHVRGFVLAKAEKDDLFTTFLITQKRATVRCVPGILDGLENGDLIAVDGVNGKVYVRPDEETFAFFEAHRNQPAPRVNTEHLPRLAREAMQTANIPEIPAMPAFPAMPPMLDKPDWGKGGNMPADTPTPADIKAMVLDAMDTVVKTYDDTKITVWQAVVSTKIDLFADRDLEPEERELVNQTVVEEYNRLEAEKLEEQKALLPPEPEPEPSDPREARRKARRDRVAKGRKGEGDGEAEPEAGEEPGADSSEEPPA